MAQSYDASVLAASLPAMTRANPALLASETYYVQELADGRIVSCGGWTREEPGSGKVEIGVGHVRHFATATSAVRRGLARGIFERCKQDTMTAGISTLMAYAGLNSEPFYTSLGFVPLRRTAIKIGGEMTFPTVVMIWEANSNSAHIAG